MRSLLHASHVGTFFIVYAPRMMSAAKNVIIKNLVNLTNRKPKQGEKTMIKTINKEQCLKLIQSHNINGFHTQTGCINGEMCEFGTSFAEQVGIRDTYTIKEVKGWLGY